jgi:3-phosphoshikimate 1-carboxyvinyltransferase
MTERHYPDKIEILPLKKQPHATILVPGSKSIANRALVIGALSEPLGGTTLQNFPNCEDTQIMVQALRDLGFSVDSNWSEGIVQIRRGAHSNRIPAQSANLLLGNSGTSMRFLAALVCLGKGTYELDGVTRMRDRPIGDLLDALDQLDVRARSLHRDGFPPIRIESAHSAFFSANLGQPVIKLKADVSSQFLSGLLMVAPFATSPFRIELTTALVSQPYVRMTVELMRLFGADTRTDFESQFEVWPVSHYESRTLELEPDATSASYFFAAAAITEGRITVPGIGQRNLQGDASFLNVLYEMGCKADREDYVSTVAGRRLHGVNVDMNAISDTVMSLAAAACFADGPTTIRNVAHIRHKESDRITAMATEIRKVGAEVDEFPDGLRITPRPLHGAEIETYDDHRIAMSMALIGLKVPGIVIKNPGCVAKTYPGFWDDLEKLRKE